MQLSSISGLALFVILNFCALSVSLSLALKTNLRGVMLWVACLEIYFFLITALLMILGAVGLLTPLWVAILAILAGLLAWTGKDFRQKAKNVFTENSTAGFFSAALLSLVCLAFFVFLLDALFHPYFPHDPLTYELYFPARWLQSGRLDLVPTPFGDNSRAYDAANACLYYLWLMLPFRNDLLAHAGGFFFAVFSAFSLIAISAEMGLKAPAKYLAGLFFLSIPLVIRETESAHSDLLLCGQFLAFLAFALGHKNKRGRGLDLLALMALGGLAGTKYIALVSILFLIPVFAFVFLRPFPKLKNLLAWIFLFFLAGGFWYLRNAYLTGNPVFPLQVQLGSWVILPGAYTRAVMSGWIFKIFAGRPMLSIITEGPRPQFQAILFFFFAASAFLAFLGGLFKSGKKDLLVIYLAVLPLLLHLMAAYLLPFHMARFWLPAWAVAALSVAIILSAFPRSYLAIVIIFFLLIATEMMIEVVSTSSGIMSIFYPATKSPGLFLKLLPFALLLSLFFRKIALTKKNAFWACVFIILGLWSQPGYFPRRAKAMVFNRESEFLERLPGPRRIAYTGRNMPYPFMGSRLEGRVFYVNVNSHNDWKFHDYEKWFKQNYPGKMPNTPEPAFYRMEQNFSAWWNNLLAQKTDLVVVCPVGINEYVNICHNREGFPIEADWAAAHPESFKLVFQDQCRVYELKITSTPGPILVDQSCPMDAMEIIKSSPGMLDASQLEKYFPYAMDQIRRNGLKLQN